MAEKAQAHKPIRYGVEKTDDGGFITFVMDDGSTQRFSLNIIDIAGIARSIIHLYGVKTH
ncbi:hypothetical protein ACDY96_00050 [Rhizobium mongolense]|uniref:hypothetical protein n=1 Tax=Rhizobium mongolense TaxID=57676 RepID=UPI003557FAA2